MISVTHAFEFPAAHVLAQPAFSDDENRRIFERLDGEIDETKREQQDEQHQEHRNSNIDGA